VLDDVVPDHLQPALELAKMMMMARQAGNP